MEATTKRLFMEMTEQLNDLQPNNILERAELSYKITKEAVTRLDEFIGNYKFTGKEEEIQYFKNIRPEFLKEQIYYVELYYIESLKPRNDKASIEQYFNDFLKQNNHYFERHRTLYSYYHSGQTHQDHQLFTKKAKSDIFLAGATIEKDHYITQGHSYILARLQALEIINGYIQNEIKKLNNSLLHTAEAEELSWTASKVALIELLYSLSSAGVFNNGKADLKTIVNIFQERFGIHLGNYYSVIQQNIRIRKKNRTAFLDQLKQSAERKMDETDENPRFM